MNLDLDMGHGASVHLQAERSLNVFREALLVPLFDRSLLLLERGVVDELEKALSARSQKMRGGCTQNFQLASSLYRSFRKAAFGILRVSLMRLLRPGLHD